MAPDPHSGQVDGYAESVRISTPTMGAASIALTLATGAASGLGAPTAVWIAVLCLAVLAAGLTVRLHYTRESPAAISGSGQDWDVSDNLIVGAPLLDAKVDRLRAKRNVTIPRRER